MKKILVGFMFGVSLTATTAAYASDAIQAFVFPAKILINGKEKSLDPQYQLLNVNGHAYVPIRYIAENTGISIAYDDNRQSILLAYGNTAITDKNNTSIAVANLLAAPFDVQMNSTKVTGQLTLNASERSYVNATLDFLDQNNQLLGTAIITDEYDQGLNTINIRGTGDVTNFSSVKLTIHDVHPALKSTIDALFLAGKAQDQDKIQDILDALPSTVNEFLLIDFMKWSVPYSNDDRSYLLPFILKRNVNVNIQDNATGYTALMYACSYGIDQINLLIEAGANVTTKANDGTTALSLLVTKGQSELVKRLLTKGADPNVQSADGYTPLLAALTPTFLKYTTETVRTVEYLLDAGANVQVTFPDGTALLDRVNSISDLDIASQIKELLLNHGVK
ncbi:ankyrin repeat domain-containing protein [Paenibacillus chartarius]|uniref:Ankyrin repeat domain-containing protein n=1 Tax=Paenibacillus chartarius TaxID=747481 RepID=A0ABV6DFJ4_9BACL